MRSPSAHSATQSRHPRSTTTWSIWRWSSRWSRRRSPPRSPPRAACQPRRCPIARRRHAASLRSVAAGILQKLKKVHFLTFFFIIYLYIYTRMNIRFGFLNKLESFALWDLRDYSIHCSLDFVVPIAIVWFLLWYCLITEKMCQI